MSTSIKPGTYITDGTVIWLITSVSSPPVGTIFQGLYVPDGFVKLNGAVVNRSEYPRLVKLATDKNLWTNDTSISPGLFGVGNTTTTMTLPNFTNYFLQNSETNIGNNIAAGLPNITGYVQTNNNGSYWFSILQSSGAFYPDTTSRNLAKVTMTQGTTGIVKAHFDASRSSAIYGKSSTVQPPSIKVIISMKY